MTFTGRIILACWIVLLLLWTAGAFFQKKSKEKPIASNIIHSLLLLASITCLLISSRILFLDYILIRVSLTVNILSILFSLSGLIVCVYSRIILGNNWSRDVMIKENHKLITEGPYKYVRHPIYSGLLMLFIGTAIAIGNLGSILGFIILLVSLILKLKQEETLMIKQFKDSYIDYIKRTKALVPYVF